MKAKNKERPKTAEDGVQAMEVGLEVIAQLLDIETHTEIFAMSPRVVATECVAGVRELLAQQHCYIEGLLKLLKALDVADENATRSSPFIVDPNQFDRVMGDALRRAGELNGYERISAKTDDELRELTLKYGHLVDENAKLRRTLDCIESVLRLAEK